MRSYRIIIAIIIIAIIIVTILTIIKIRKKKQLVIKIILLSIKFFFGKFRKRWTMTPLLLMLITIMSRGVNVVWVALINYKNTLQKQTQMIWHRDSAIKKLYPEKILTEKLESPLPLRWKTILFKWRKARKISKIYYLRKIEKLLFIDLFANFSFTIIRNQKAFFFSTFFSFPFFFFSCFLLLSVTKTLILYSLNPFFLFENTSRNNGN